MTEPPATGMADPGPSTPDDSDWTWVLSRPCPDCGFDASALTVDEVPAVLRDAATRYAVRLAAPDVRTRPSTGVWSPLEYSCHVRDVCDVMRGRLEQILDGGGELVQFANWDQDETAVRSSTGAPTPRTSSVRSPLPSRRRRRHTADPSGSSGSGPRCAATDLASPRARSRSTSSTTSATISGT